MTDTETDPEPTKTDVEAGTTGTDVEEDEEDEEDEEEDGSPCTIPDDASETRRALRAIAEDVRADSSESQQVAAILYRVSDLYDPAEDTSPEAIYRNVRQILRVKAQGGLDR